MTKLGKTIQILRQARGMKLCDLAKKCNISTPYLSLLESGSRQPSLAVIDKIAAALEVSPDVLLLLGTGSETIKTSNPGVGAVTRAIESLIAIEDDLKRAIATQGGRGEPKAPTGRVRRACP